MINVTKKLFSILNSKQRKFIFVLGLMMLVGGVLESISVSLMLPLIQAVMSADDWNSTWYSNLLCNIFSIHNHRMYIICLLILLIIIFILKNLYLLYEYYIQYSFIAKSRYEMQHSLMHSYLCKPYSFFTFASSGEIIRIVTQDTIQTFNILTYLLLFYTEIVVCVVLGVTIFIMSPFIALGTITILLFELVVINKIIKPKMQQIGGKERDASAKSNKWLLQSINGIKSIKVANNEDFFENQYVKYADISVEEIRKYQTLGAIPRLVIEAFTIAGVLGIILILVLSGVELTLIVPQLSAFAVAAMRILPSVNRVTSAMSSIPYQEGGLNNIINVLQNSDISHSNLKETKECNVENNIDSFGEICFKNIVFKYDGNNTYIFNDASFSIKIGSSVGIVGQSGAGKTTAMDIMLGLLTPQSGQIIVDGNDVNVNKSEWLKRLAYIPQTIFLMDENIRENVIFGRVDDSTDERVWAALEEAQMAEFVRSLPEGLDTRIGEQGVRLSGGQRQRIGIARALYTNPQILFFDEATSALDNETESAIMESINKLKGSKTLVIIAHRLSTIENCDEVYCVKNGKVIKQR